MTTRENDLVDIIRNTDKIILHKDHKVKSGGRKGNVESLSDFKDRLKELADKVREDEYMDDIPALLYEETSSLYKDRKIFFDLENIDEVDEGNLDCGVPWILCYAGGDWEMPVYFFVYPEAKTRRPRLYIPTRGNAFNNSLKVAFGSEDEVTMDFDFNDRICYIIEHSGLADGYSKKEIQNIVEFMANNDDEYIGDKVDYDTDLMLEEFKERIAI